MMVYAVLLLIAFQSVVVALWAREHRHALEVIESVAKSGSPDLRELCELIREQAQRIQAPELAVAAYAQDAMSEDIKQHVPMFDDEEHWASKEELAEALNGRS